ncbi:glycine--tRNA ligase [Candidatus Micrarchaeota archaeon]|nr:glycine--tRNA ligase [Candidatus Micrarchaeota archaeon]
MSKKNTLNPVSQELTAFLSEKDFVYGPEPELYGGIAGFYTYGPLGKRLKNNLENAIRTVFNQHGFFEVEYPIIAPAAVWKASGHLDSFNDPVIICSKCASSFRADKLLEEKGEKNAEHYSDQKLIETFKKKEVNCPNCKGRFNLEIKRHSLMMKTTIGQDTEAYNRPETATTTYLPFKHYQNFFRDKLPFSVFQIGKAFRNEISPRQHVLRSREFSQAESQLFVSKEMKTNWPSFKPVENDSLLLWTAEMQEKNKKPETMSLKKALQKKAFQNQAFAWNVWLSHQIFLAMGIPNQKMRLRQHKKDERAFYAEDAWDLEIELNSFDWTECCGIHDRTDYDLKKHAEFSKQKLVAKDEKGKEFVPHVLEIAFGIDRPFFALCDLFYAKRKEDQKRILLQFPPKMAPIQVAVFPLMAKDGLDKKAREIYQTLEKKFLVYYDESGSIGRRYSRMDAVGTPYCLTIDYDSLEKNDVTIRERDSMKQTRILISELSSILQKYSEK